MEVFPIEAYLSANDRVWILFARIENLWHQDVETWCQTICSDFFPLIYEHKNDVELLRAVRSRLPELDLLSDARRFSMLLLVCVVYKHALKAEFRANQSAVLVPVFRGQIIILSTIERFLAKQVVGKIHLEDPDSKGDDSPKFPIRSVELITALNHYLKDQRPILVHRIKEALRVEDAPL